MQKMLNLFVVVLDFRSVLFVPVFLWAFFIILMFLILSIMFVCLWFLIIVIFDHSNEVFIWYLILKWIKQDESVLVGDVYQVVSGGSVHLSNLSDDIIMTKLHTFILRLSLSWFALRRVWLWVLLLLFHFSKLIFFNFVFVTASLINDYFLLIILFCFLNIFIFRLWYFTIVVVVS